MIPDVSRDAISTVAGDIILARMDEDDTGSLFHDVRMGSASYRLHITLSAQFRIARISAVRTREA